MAAPSDAVVIGIILTLVFSAAIYYIYTLLQQLEGKVNVLNTIIFELKKTNEQYINMYEGGGGNFDATPLESFSMAENYESKIAEKNYLPTETPNAEQAEGIYMDFDLGESKAAAAEPAAEKKEPVSESSLSTFAGAAEPASSLLSVNYESMTYKELKAEAKRRHIKGHSNLSKQELIDALKQLDAGTEDVEGISSGLGVSAPGFQSIAAIDGVEAEEYIPNFEDVINLN